MWTRIEFAQQVRDDPQQVINRDDRPNLFESFFLDKFFFEQASEEGQRGRSRSKAGTRGRSEFARRHHRCCCPSGENPSLCLTSARAQPAYRGDKRGGADLSAEWVVSTVAEYRSVRCARGVCCVVRPRCRQLGPPGDGFAPLHAACRTQAHTLGSIERLPPLLLLPPRQAGG